MRRLRAVLDTNVVVSALLFPGVASRMVGRWQSGAFAMLASREMIGECLRVLAYPKFDLSESEIRSLLDDWILPYVTAVKVPGGFGPICRDPGDDMFLACAEAGRADLIVTGDKDLLVLKTHGRCRIVTVVEALKLLKG